MCTTRALRATSHTSATLLAATNSDGPSTCPHIPARCPWSHSHPSAIGTKTAAGNSRRARTPPAASSTRMAGSPVSRRASTTPRLSVAKQRAVSNAMPDAGSNVYKWAVLLRCPTKAVKATTSAPVAHHWAGRLPVRLTKSSVARAAPTSTNDSAALVPGRANEGHPWFRTASPKTRMSIPKSMPRIAS